MISELMCADTGSEEWEMVDELHDETSRKDQDFRTGKRIQYYYYLLLDDYMLYHKEVIASDSDEEDIVADSN